MYIHTENMFHPEIKFIPFGTIGYVKTTNNEVRQCKCLGGKSKRVNENGGLHDIEYEWKVAGYKEHFFTFSSCCLSIGHIYVDEVSAQRGSADTNYGMQKGEMTFSNSGRVFPIFNYLINKYGMSEKCFQCAGTWNTLFRVETYAKFKDHTTGLRRTDFEVIVDKNGIDCRIPMLDGEVNGIHRYPTAEKAYASMEPLPTFTLDDDDVAPVSTKIKVTIGVEVENLDNVKKYATILEK